MSSPVKFFTDRHDVCAKMLVLLQKNKDEEKLWTPGWHLYGETYTQKGWYLSHILVTLIKTALSQSLEKTTITDVELQKKVVWWLSLSTR